MAYKLLRQDAIRVKAIKHNVGDGDSQCCRFSIDPELTGFETLCNLVSRAFDLKHDFQTCYLARDERYPEACWLPLLSDFDLELAFLKSSDPYLLIKVDSVSNSDSWDLVSNFDIPRLNLPEISKNNYSVKLPVIFKEKVEKTFLMMQKAFSWSEEQQDDMKPLRPPLTDADFQKLLDNVGTLKCPNELRQSVYLGGVEPSLRKVVWKHLLNVYPEGMTGQERMNYIKFKTQEYLELRRTWQTYLKSDKVSEEVIYITNMVRKDVHRTDRHHSFFSGPDDSRNVQSLYNILTTYSLNHPSVGYCQGMSDLASPLLVTMKDEAQAYICFCALMSRVHSNFHIDGNAMTLKFQHLTEALIYYDVTYFSYLQRHQADDLLFCYRWLLLELKREFAFEDAQLMLEVLWSSLAPDPPEESLSLVEMPFNLFQVEEASVPSTPRQNHYANVCALRRQRSCVSDKNAEMLASLLCKRTISIDGAFPKELKDRVKRLERTMSHPARHSKDSIKVEVSESPESSPTKSSKKIKDLKEFQLLSKKQFISTDNENPSISTDSKNKVDGSTLCASRRCYSDSDADESRVPVYDGGDTDVWQNPVACLSSDDESFEIVCQDEQPIKPQKTFGCENELTSKISSASSVTNSCEETFERNWLVTTTNGTGCITSLPPPEEFGGGNPFLMFLCLTLLLQHRQYIIQHNLDHNELAMHFDRMVRKHNVCKVLAQARKMFEAYLKQDFWSSRVKSSPSSTVTDESC